MTFKHDALVYLGLIMVILAFVTSAFVIRTTPDTDDPEARKIRFAAVTFTGILTLFIFTAILYFSEPTGPGEKIFEKALTSMSPLAGAIIGYLFGAKK